MVLVGGATRLTDSGLSITEWKPLLGIIPPLSDADWQDAFTKYQQIPEYHMVNKGMSLEAFKFIYWWEWSHRFLGRAIGFAFLIPFLIFWAKGMIPRAFMPRLIVMFVLGGLQGVLGWYMVKSGLVDRVDVSQYRLAAHLCAALLIFSYIFWVALDLRPAGPARVQGDGVLAASSAGLVGLLFLQIALGAFVAGLDAGQGYNTWPLMDGALIPSGLGAMSPWYLNLFENALTVQFNHRMLAYLVALWAVIHAVASYRRAGEGPVSLTASVIVLAIVVQIALGVATLLSHVALDLALMHQGGAVVLLALALYQLHQFVGQPQAGGIA